MGSPRISLVTEIGISCVDFCRALADDTRQSILVLLAENGEMCVSDLVDAFDTTQPTISHHLSVLNGVGLVHRRRAGKHIYYAADAESIEVCCGRIFTKFVPTAQGD